VSVGLGWLKRGTYSADKVEGDLELDDDHGRQMFETRGRGEGGRNLRRGELEGMDIGSHIREG
jgi:hypothetical protein